MKKIKHIVNAVIWVLVGLYLAVTILVNLPFVQSALGDAVASALSKKLGTQVWVGRVDLGLFNRIIIDDVRIADQRGETLLRSSRLSVKFDYLDLAQGKIVITSAQLFGAEAHLYKLTAEAKPNYQFVLDSLASKTPQKESSLNLSIASLIIRHTSVSYDLRYLPVKSGFDVHHLLLNEISCHLVLDYLTPDSVSAGLKKLAFEERSGLKVNQLCFSFKANKQGAVLQNFLLKMPHSEVDAQRLAATYRVENGQLQLPSLEYRGSVAESYILPQDLDCFIPAHKFPARPVVFQAAVSGTSTHLRVSSAEFSVAQLGHHLSLRAPSDIHLSVSGSVSQMQDRPRWFANVKDLSWTDAGLALLAGQLPEVIHRFGRVKYRGEVGGVGLNVATKGELSSDAGDAHIFVGVDGDRFSGSLQTKNLNLGQIADNHKLGLLSTSIDVTGQLRKKAFSAKGLIHSFEYDNYTYRNLKVDGIYANKTIDGQFSIDDANLVASINGKVSLGSVPTAKLQAQVRRANPAELLPGASRWKGKTFSGDLSADLKGKNMNTVNGTFELSNFDMQSAANNYHLDHLNLTAQNKPSGHQLFLQSDFAQVQLEGRFDYNTFLQSVENLVVKKLPSIQQLTSLRHRPVANNEFVVNAEVSKSDWLNAFLGLPINLQAPLAVKGYFSDRLSAVNATVHAPLLSYDGKDYQNVDARLSTESDTLRANVSLSQLTSTGRNHDYRLEASAINDQLSSSISFDNHAYQQRLRGTLHSVTHLFRDQRGTATAEIAVKPSVISIGDSLLTVAPSTITYSKNHLAFNHFSIAHGNQWLEVNGVATESADDSLVVDLHKVDVAYVMQLVNFDDVDFAGYASGKASISQLFGRPDAHAKLRVDDFNFEEGQMGTLYAAVKWNPSQQQIELDAQAVDTLGNDRNGRVTDITGYVSLKRNYIDLNFNARNTRGDFVEGFCSSFLNRTNLTVNGDVRLWGDLKDINLTGELVASGSLGVKSLNTVYTLSNDTIQFLYNQFCFPHVSVHDRNGQRAVISGRVFHQHLSQFSYDLHVDADRFLAYDWDGSDGSSFYGTVIGSGGVDIKGKPGEVVIDVRLAPTTGSTIYYDASSPDAISSQDFIHWHSRDSLDVVMHHPDSMRHVSDIPSDIHVNFLINATPDATLKVIMDKSTGDYIALNGAGTINATFYNKGGVDVFGNYTIDHGVYKLTIQNVIRREFQFTQGGTIAFGGNPMDAVLQLKALYPVNSVSLADLQLGRSFSNNNIRVDCYMNITGTPRQPHVDFNLDMPTVGTDAKQMIFNLINSQEEMNQQVLYLLAVGRFYSQGANNAADQTGQNRTSLAMQSILSSQISQQLNNVIGTVLGNANSNWNVGANISTGDEGWNNAEYEGLLSGRLLNNRLLVNGQFGYRDNANATTSFIGDFDVRYLIFPNGNFSIRVYNQTNDRYFTRNTLNTQGLGFVLKKDFNGWRDLFSWKRKTTEKARKNKKKSKPAEPTAARKRSTQP